MKKTLAFISALVITSLSVPMSIASAEEYTKGDVDMDGVITGHDAAIVSQYADSVLQLELNDEQLALADMNDDGAVDASDAALIAEIQEYKLGDMDRNGEVRIEDATDILTMAFWRKIDPKIDFGKIGISADVECDGDIDVYDAYSVLDYYRKYGVFLPTFEEGKYYIIITSEIEQDFLKTSLNVEPGYEDCKTISEYYDRIFEKNIATYTDMDGDKQLTISDATAILQTYAENAAGAGLYKAAAYDKMDVNLDGVIDIEDATLILKAYAMDAAGLL